MRWPLPELIDPRHMPLLRQEFLDRCKRTLDEEGALVLPDFLTPAAVAAIRQDGQDNQHRAFYTVGRHNIAWHAAACQRFAGLAVPCHSITRSACSRSV